MFGTESTVSEKNSNSNNSQIVPSVEGETEAEPVGATSESKFVFDYATGEDTNDSNLDSSNEQPSTVWLFVRMILVLLLVIIIIYALVYFLKKSGKNIANDDLYLKRTASLTVSAGKTVQVVTLGEKAYLIGVSDTSVNLLAEIDDSDLVSAMNLSADAEPTGKTKDFASILARFTQSAAESTNFGLKKQQERLKKLSTHPKDSL